MLVTGPDPTPPDGAATPAPGDTSPAVAEAAADATAPSGALRWRAFALRHAPFAAVLLAGAVLRALTMVAYRPAFLGSDSRLYLRAASTLHPKFDRPEGYSLLLRAIPHWQALWPVALVQHLLCLAAAVLIYLLLIRRQVPAWGAALATVPLLLDPWQLAVEHFVLSDSAFVALVVIGFFLLFVRRRIPWGVALAAGLVLGFAVTVRGVGEFVLVPVALAVLLGQARWRPAVALLVGAAVSIGGYSAWYHHYYGSYTTAAFPAHQLYGRVAPFVDCSTLKVPDYERPLCPAVPKAERRSSQYYTWAADSPWRTFPVPAGMDRWNVLHDFDVRVVTQEPVTYARVVGWDFLSGFAPTRSRTEPGTDPQRWQFQDAYPSRSKPTVAATLSALGLRPHVDHGVAGILTAYRKHFYVPGPIFAACLLAALLAVAGVGRARRSGLRSAAAVFSLSTVMMLATAAGVSLFSWRYQVPQFALLPPAGALGLTALLRRTPDPDAMDGRQAARELLRPVLERVPGRRASAAR